MKRYPLFLLLFVLLFILGCSCRPPQEKKDILARVNNYEISSEEFDEEFKNSLLSKIDNEEMRKEFLANLINRKLILQDAQNRGFDKDPAFLKMIERFWEQSLVRMTLDKKMRDIEHSCGANDKEVKAEYDKRVAEGKTSKSYEDMYSQIHWELVRDKEAKAMNDWMAGLNKKADIKINYDLLKEKR